jgi:uncharacterized membrane protein YidH (DUF202 family)
MVPSARAPRLDRLPSGDELRGLLATGELSGPGAEALLAEGGVPRHELLGALAEAHGCPFVEYGEDVTGPRDVLRRTDPEALKRGLWFPLSVRAGAAKVVAWNPTAASDEVRKTLGVERVEWVVALPADIVRLVENSQDLNPGFPRSAGRTPLAKVRNDFALRRSRYACVRTSLARGRTGLALFRTGLSFVTIALVLFRVLGPGFLSVVELLLVGAGGFLIVEGLRWYLPTRRAARRPVEFDTTRPTGGTTVLEAIRDGEGDPRFARSEPVPGAAALREGWNRLSPVMRRRFLASDRTDLAEERTYLASLRTKMARARTGLAFARTGIAFGGVGIALLRTHEFRTGAWPLFDAALLAIGAAMMIEGLVRYLGDRRAGAQGDESVRSAADAPSVWEAVLPPRFDERLLLDGVSAVPPVALTHDPGIWGTTGLALERTVLADGRCVMARLRTIMARSRTGLAFVRTGMLMCAVAGGLLVYFGDSSAAWAALYVLLFTAGALLVADGLWWHLPAERSRRQLPYCYCDVEIPIPDYGKPARSWAKVVFSHDDA